MTFLQPILLAALPLISLPIIIHLINRQRHRTVQWGAMMFLLDAKRMTRGMAQLRYWLIMAMRMLAIAGLVFAVSRPLASGWLGIAVGGGADTTIVILDRSVSMQQQELQSGRSKQTTALRKLSDLLTTVSSGTELVLIENTENQAVAVESPEVLPRIPQSQPTSTTADIPAMLQTALDYVVANQTGRTDIWVCSDQRASDWLADDGRWATVRSEFERLDGVRFYLLSYTQPADDNLSVSVAQARIRQTAQATELILDVNVQSDNEATNRNVPLEFVINGARSVLNLDLTESEYTLQGHTIEIDAATKNGWGRVELPLDSNLSDNVYCFAFSEPPVHRSVIVTDDEMAGRAFKIALTAPVDPTIVYEATVLSPQQVDEIDWRETSAIIWQTALPDELVSKQIEAFAKSGRPVIFFAPQQTLDRELFGMKWGDWQSAATGSIKNVVSWRGDSDLLRHTQSGQALPVGELKTFRHRLLMGNASSLAQLDGSLPLLVKSTDAPGPVYFCTTLPMSSHSTLAQDGVAFYVMLQRVLTTGAATQGAARQLTAGTEAVRQLSDWDPVFTVNENVLSSTRWTQVGVLQNKDRFVAINRPLEEDQLQQLDKDQIRNAFGSLQYRHVEDRVDGGSDLASEIWRAFLLAMAFALIFEALLCLPDQRVRSIDLRADTPVTRIPNTMQPEKLAS